MVKITAYQPVENILIKKFRAEYTGELISGSSFDLFYKFKDGYIYILSYGVVVFANVDEIDRSNFLLHIKEYGEYPLENRLQEDFIIEKSNSSNLEFSYNSLSVPEINTDIIRICMLQVAQSITLDFYLSVSQQLATETVKLTNQLEEKGKFNVPKKKLLKFIGATLNTKNRIIDDLYIIDSPPVVWENELLGKVNAGLEKIFDINIRYKEVEYILKNVEGNISVFIDLTTTQESHRLEWIIIVLIMVEVVHMVVTEFF